MLGDIKILYNDWPYGLEEGIKHLVVWTKFGFEVDGEKGELTEAMVKLVEEYVDRVFVQKLGQEKVRFASF